jgi:hypothetical protein
MISNLIFTKSIDSEHGKIARTLKFWGQLRANLKKFTVNDQNKKRFRTLKIQSAKIKGKIKEI